MHSTAFIKPRWKPLVITPEGLDRKFYEICALSELKNALRSGDIWVRGSRQFRDFDDYLLPAEKFAAPSASRPCPPAINLNSDQYRRAFAAAGRAVGHRHPPAKDNELPDAILTESGLKITPLDAAVPDRGAGADRPNQPVTAAHQDHRTADGRGRLDGLQPPLHPLEGRGRGQRQDVAAVRNLGDAINLGLTKMAESSPGLTYAKLSRCKPAHPRRNPFGGLGRAGQPPVSPRLCRPLGRRHDLILRWPALPRGWPGREHRARQPEVR